MFTPKYTITNRLLTNISRIHTLIAQLNSRRFPHVVLVEFEKTARAVSAHSSTSIEGNPLPLTEVKKILKVHPRHVRDSEKEVLNYNKALEVLDANLKSGKANLTHDLILAIQGWVTDGLLSKIESGHVRHVPVVVNNPLTGKVVYIPPDSKDINNLLSDLLDYLNQGKLEIDPLILAGVFHKQFVLIHPFTDGNGRTTRLSTKVLLAAMGLNTFNLFSFENYYSQNVTKYFQKVGELGDYYDIAKKVDFTDWLEYFTEGIIDELLRVAEFLPKAMTPAESLKPYHHTILDIINERGFVKDADYALKTKRAKPTRHLDFQKLIALGLIERRGQGRASYYVLRELN